MTQVNDTVTVDEAERWAFTKRVVEKLAIHHVRAVSRGKPGDIDGAVVLEAYRRALADVKDAGRIVDFTGPQWDAEGKEVHYKCTFPRPRRPTDGNKEVACTCQAGCEKCGWTRVRPLQMYVTCDGRCGLEGKHQHTASGKVIPE